MNIFYKNLTFSTGIRCKINDSLVNLIAKLDGPKKLAPIDLTNPFRGYHGDKLR